MINIANQARLSLFKSFLKKHTSLFEMTAYYWQYDKRLGHINSNI